MSCCHRIKERLVILPLLLFRRRRVGRVVGGRASGGSCSSCSKKQQRSTGTGLFFIWCRRLRTIVLQEIRVSVSCRSDVVMKSVSLIFIRTLKSLQTHETELQIKKKIFKEFFLKTTHRQSMSMEVSLLLQTLF